MDSKKLASLLDDALVGINEESDDEFDPFKKVKKQTLLSEVRTDEESPHKLQ